MSLIITGSTKLDVLVDGDESTCIKSQDLDLLAYNNKTYNTIRVLSDVNATNCISGTAVFESPVDCGLNSVLFSKEEKVRSRASCIALAEAVMGNHETADTRRCSYTMYCDAQDLFCEIYVLPSASQKVFTLCELYF